MDKDPRAATSRSKGAVGRDPLVYRAFRENWSVGNAKGMNILDYGAGKGAVHTRKLRAEGYPVLAYDLPENTDIFDGIWRENANCEYWDIVLVSNVLNVQGDVKQVKALLEELESIVPNGGQIFMNYPATPRKAGLSTIDMRNQIAINMDFSSKDVVGGTKSAPCWLINF